MKNSLHNALLIALGAVAGAAGVAALRPPARPSVEAGFVTSAERLLEKRLPEVNLEAVPLNRAVALLSASAEVPIEVDSVRMAASGLSPSKPVTVRLRNVDLMGVLDAMLLDFNSTDPTGVAPANLYWCVTSEGVLISDWNGVTARTRMITRVYDISPLAPDAVKSKPVAGTNWCFPTPPDPRDNLEILIQSLVRPESWRASGMYGATSRLGNRLVVVQSADAQVQIRRLIDQLVTPRPAALPTPSPGPEAYVFHPVLKRWTSLYPERADAALAKSLATFEVTELPLEAAVEKLSMESGLDLLLHHTVFDESAGPAAVSRQRKITLSTRDLPAWRILREILNQAATNADPADLTWWLDGSVVVIGAGMPELMVRVYDIGDYLNAAVAEPPLQLGIGRKAERSWDELIEQLISSLTDQVAPDSWRENGGLGSARELGGQLVVSQTWENHERVRRYLADVVKRAESGREMSSRP